MKVIPEGSVKYLMFDRQEIERNVQRRRRLGPAVVVAEVDESARGGFIFHGGYGLLVEGAVAATSEPHGKVLDVPGYYGRRERVRAALMTTDRVALATMASPVK